MANAFPRIVVTRRTILQGILLTFVMAAVAALWFGWPGSRRTTPTLPADITAEEYAQGREAFELRYGRAADEFDVLSWLGEWNLSKKRLPKAVACFDAIPSSHPKYGRMARYLQGQALLNLHRATEAELQFVDLIKLEESSPQLEPGMLIDARQRLRHILEVELRFEERHQLLQGVVDRDEADSFEAVSFCFLSLLRWNGPDTVKWLEEFHAADPTSPWLNIALGRYRTGQGRLEEARQILEGVVHEHPSNRRALAALIACLREADALEEVTRRMEGLPPQSADDPWLLLLQRGADALQNGRPLAAVAAYEQLLQQDRTCTEAWQGLAQASRLLDDQPRRKRAIEMTTMLGRIQNHLGKAIQNASDPNSFLDIADLCAEISFNREGWILTQCARKLAPSNPRVLAAVELFRKRLSAVREDRSGEKMRGTGQ